MEPPSSRGADPTTSHSDWTISVESGNQQATYHVHKPLLSVGPRSCEYFSTLFQTKTELSETQNDTSHITLDERDAGAVPTMLDFIYSPTGEIDTTTEKPIALRSLDTFDAEN